MPISRVRRRRSNDDILRILTPSIQISPASGGNRPRMHFSSTDFPVPEPPMTTSEAPSSTSRSTPRKTSLRPKDFFSPRTEIFGVAPLISNAHEQRSHDVIRREDCDRRSDDGRARRRFGGNEESENARLDKAGDDIVGRQKLVD